MKTSVVTGTAYIAKKYPDFFTGNPTLGCPLDYNFVRSKSQ